MKFIFTFETFDEPELRAAVNAAHQFILELSAGTCNRWLSFIGSSGTGKSFLMKQVRNMWRQFAPLTSWAWVDWPKIVGEAMTRDRNMAGTLVDLCDTPVVFLDEIGSDRDKSEWVADCLARLLSGRVGKPTVITSNCTLEQLARIDVRIASRMIRDENIKIELVRTMDFALRTLK